MSIMSKIFGSAAPAPATAPATPVPTPAEPGNIPPAAGTTVPPVGTAAPNGIIPEVKTPDSRLDPFKDMWEPITTEASPTGLPIAIDKAKLAEVIGKADFSKSLNPESLAAITAGGEGAVAALVDVINTNSRQLLTQTTLATDQMVQQAFEGYNTAQTKNLPQLMKAQGLSNNLSENPVFNNPAVVPIIEAVKTTLAANNPNATVAQLTEMAHNYIEVMGEAFTPKPAVDPNSTAATTNWDKYMQNS